MIFVDDREGAIELHPLLAAGGVKAEVKRLEFGDFCFEGNGPRGMCLIGIERKRLRDTISSMRTGRFSGHQLPGMLSLYDFCWLMVEGIWQSGSSGLLEEGVHGGWRPLSLGSSNFMARDLEHYLSTLELHTPLHIRRTSDPHQTVASILNLYRYFTDKEWSAHHAHHQFHNAPDPTGIVTQPSLVRRVAKEFDGIGWERSRAVAARFHTVLDLAMADEREWQRVPGIGELIAHRVVSQIRGKD
jgi:ERCC4-type nuclease